MGTNIQKVNATIASKAAFDGALRDIGINIPEKFADYPPRLVGIRTYDVDGSLEYVGIPSSISSIRMYVLSGMTKITELSIPSTVQSINTSAFGNSSLQNVTMTGRTKGATVSIANFPFGLGDSVVFHCTDGDFHGARYIAAGTTALPANAFKDNADIIMGIMPSTVTSVGSKAYSNCQSLEYVEFPSSVSSLANDVFAGTSPDSVRFIGKTMQGVSGISNFPFGITSSTMPFLCTDGRLYNDRWKWGIADSSKQPTISGTTVTIGNQVGSVVANAFKDNLNIFTVENKSYCLEHIALAAFKGCTSISSFTAGAHDAYNRQNTYTIGESAFEGCTSLSSFTNSLASSIGNKSFYGCTHLPTASFQKCTFIGISSFEGCTALSSVSFPIMTYIGKEAFKGCTSLVSATFPSVTEIGVRAFAGSGASSLSFPSIQDITTYGLQNATSLTSITASAATTVKPYAFKGCTSLSSVTFQNADITLEEGAFEDCTTFQLSGISCGENYIILNGVRSLSNTNLSNNGNTIKATTVWKNEITTFHDIGYPEGRDVVKNAVKSGILSTITNGGVIANMTLLNATLGGGVITSEVGTYIYHTVSWYTDTAKLTTTCTYSALGSSYLSTSTTPNKAAPVPSCETTGTNKQYGIVFYTPKVNNLLLQNCTRLNGYAFYRDKIGTLDAPLLEYAADNATNLAEIDLLKTYSFLDNFTKNSLTGVKSLKTTVYTKNQIKNLATFPFGMVAGSTIIDKNGETLVIE